MPVIYNGKSPEQRIQDRLRSSSPNAATKVQDHRPSDASVTTNPVRTISSCYYRGQQTPQTKSKGGY
jgi:hypothetical protein